MPSGGRRRFWGGADVMVEWVVFQSPVALLLYGAALGCSLFERATKSTKGILTLISAVLAVAATGVLILLGGSLWEAATMLLVFLLLHMGVNQ